MTAHRKHEWIRSKQREKYAESHPQDSSDISMSAPSGDTNGNESTEGDSSLNRMEYVLSSLSRDHLCSHTDATLQVVVV